VRFGITPRHAETPAWLAQLRRQQSGKSTQGEPVLWYSAVSLFGVIWTASLAQFWISAVFGYLRPTTLAAREIGRGTDAEEMLATPLLVDGAA
jgi:hypothetical protein